jgi:hypothetical protein
VCFRNGTAVENKKINQSINQLISIKTKQTTRSNRFRSRDGSTNGVKLARGCFVCKPKQINKFDLCVCLKRQPAGPTVFALFWPAAAPASLPAWKEKLNNFSCMQASKPHYKNKTHVLWCSPDADRAMPSACFCLATASANSARSVSTTAAIYNNR